MIDADTIKAILDQYSKHGWTLRRALLSASLAATLDKDVLFAGAEIHANINDALWFSRRSQPGFEAWELRRLSASPYALVDVIPDEFDPAEREERLRQVESKMFESGRRQETSH